MKENANNNNRTNDDIAIPAQQSAAGRAIRQGIKRWVVQMSLSLFILGLLLFLVAGKLNWTAGWVFLGMNAITQLLSAIILIPRQAGMLAE